MVSFWVLGLGGEFSRGEVWVLCLGGEFWVVSDIGPWGTPEGPLGVPWGITKKSFQSAK